MPGSRDVIERPRSGLREAKAAEFAGQRSRDKGTPLRKSFRSSREIFSESFIKY